METVRLSQSLNSIWFRLAYVTEKMCCGPVAAACVRFMHCPPVSTTIYTTTSYARTNYMYMYLQHDPPAVEDIHRQHAGGDDIVHMCEWRAITVHVTLEEGQAGSVAHTHLAAR